MPVFGRKEMAALEGLFHVPCYVEEEPKPRGYSGFNYEQRIRGRGRTCWFEGCIPRSPPLPSSSPTRWLTSGGQGSGRTSDGLPGWSLITTSRSDRIAQPGPRGTRHP